MNKWLKVLAGGLVMTSAATVLVACSNSKADSKGLEKSLTWMTTSEIQTLDQNKMVDTSSSEQATNVFEGLNRVGKNGKIEPGVATVSIASKGWINLDI